MATTIATVTPEGFALPPDVMANLNLKPGFQVMITVGDELHDLFGVHKSEHAMRRRR